MKGDQLMFNLRTFKRTILVYMALVWACPAAVLADPLTATGTATTRIILPLSMDGFHGINFGRFSSGSATGTITVPFTGSATHTGAITPIPGNLASRGGFDVHGEPSHAYKITGSSNAILSTVTLPGPGDPTMNIDLSYKTGNTGVSGTPVVTGALDGSGDDSVIMAGTLNVGVSQAVGLYFGSFDVTVDYQ